MKSIEYDIVVLGGGCAGVAAALECSRSGLKTALIEKTVLWGGLATSGLIPIYMPLCNGKGRQVTFGISEEMLLASIKYGYGRVPENWLPGQTPVDEKEAFSDLWEGSSMCKRYQCRFNPSSFVLAMDELLETAGTELWLDTLACVPVMQGDAVTGVEVENKSGRILVKGACFIDATGEGDLAYRAGAPAKKEKGSFPYMCWYSASLEKAERTAKTGFAGNLIGCDGVGANEWGKGYDGDLPELNGIEGNDVSTFILASRKLARQKIIEKQKGLGLDGREKYYPTALPTMHQIRMTRMIRCHETVADEPNRREGTSVGMISDCRQLGAVWEVPYGSLVPVKIRNMLVAGRCIDAEDYSWHVTRLIQAAAFTGQACGVAAGLAVLGATSPDAIDPKDVQAGMEKRGIHLHI